MGRKDLPTTPTIINDPKATVLHRNQGADSVVFLASNGTTVIKEYHQLQARIGGKINALLENYKTDTERAIAILDQKKDWGDIMVNGQKYSITCRAVKQGTPITQNGTVGTKAPEYVPGPTLREFSPTDGIGDKGKKGHKIILIPSNKKDILSILERIQNHLNSKLNRRFNITVSNVKIQADSNKKNIALIITDLAFDLTATYTNIPRE